MSIEINRFIRQLEALAETHKNHDLFVKVHNESAELVDPDSSKFEFDNDYKDRIVVINGE